jgi:hypothetical protein
MRCVRRTRSRGGAEHAQFSWDYSHVASLWQEDGWLDKNASAYASVHYGAYAITTKRGLKYAALRLHPLHTLTRCTLGLLVLILTFGTRRTRSST